MPSGIWLYAYLGLWGIVMFETLLLVAVVRQVGDFHSYWVTDEAHQGMPVGDPVPYLPKNYAVRDGLPHFEIGRSRVLLFLTVRCSACREAIRLVPGLLESTEHDVVLLFKNSESASRLFLAEHRLEPAVSNLYVYADQGQALFDRYQVEVTPYAMLIDEQGILRAKGVASSRDRLDRFFRQMKGAPRETSDTADHRSELTESFETGI